MITAGDFKKGITIEWDGGVWNIVDFQHVKPGKGAAFVRTKIKNVMTGAVVERSFNPTDKMPKAIIETKEMQYVYNDGDGSDRIYNYGVGDKVSITTSSTVKVKTSGDDVVFTVGKGKITLDNVAGKDIHYVVNGQTKIFADIYSDNFIADDDDFIVADNQLSSIVRDGAASSYSTTRLDDTFTFTAENSSLPALTYSSKK